MVKKTEIRTLLWGTQEDRSGGIYLTMKSFYQKVYAIVKQIPAGKVLTYQDVAKLVGSDGASRAVGSAMKNNPDKSIIPCHRVVGSTGTMNGYAFGGEVVKVEILKKEGVIFNGDKVDLTKSRWNAK